MNKIHIKKIKFVICYLLFTICYFLSNVCFIFTQDFLSDVPKDHWARQAIEKLVAEGWIDAKDKFNGKEYVTRYELAKVLAKILERMEQEDLLISEGKIQSATPDTKTLPEGVNIDNLIKEFAPELSEIKSKPAALEVKLKSLEGELGKVSANISKIKIDMKKDLAMINKDLKGVQRSIDNLQTEQTRIIFSGEGTVVMDNKDYSASGMSPTAEFNIDKGVSFDGRTAFVSTGSAPPSIFRSFDIFRFKIKGSPKITSQTDKRIELHALLSTERNLGSPYDYPVLTLGDSTPSAYPVSITYTPEMDPIPSSSGSSSSNDSARPFTGFSSPNLQDLQLEDFYILYDAPRSKFLQLRGGNTSVGWSLLSLSLLGYKFQGIKTAGMIGKRTIEGLYARIRKAQSPSGSTKGVYEENLYGISLLTTFMGTNTLRLSYVKNYHNVDSISVADTDKEKYQPNETSVFSAYTRFKLSSLSYLTGELAWSNRHLYAYAPYVDNKRYQVPITKQDDYAALFIIDYNKKGFLPRLLYARQNPDFRNRYGGVLDLVTSFGGDTSAMGGLNLSSLLNGGIEAYGTMITLIPQFAKGLSINLVAVKGSEVSPTKLSKLPKTLGIKAIESITIDGDVDRRSNLLKLLVLMPGFDYKPSFKTTLSFSLLSLTAALQDDIMGVNTTSDVQNISGSIPVTATLALNSPMPYQGSGIDYVSKQDPRSSYSWFQYTIQENGVDVNKFGIVYPDKVEFYKDTNGDSALSSNEIVSTSSNVQMLNGGEIYVDQSGTCAVSAQSSIQTFPCAGQYVYVNNKIKRIAPKRLSLKIAFFSPKLKLIHQFSPKLKYQFEYSQQDIKIKEVIIPGTPLNTVDAFKEGIGFERKINLSQLLTYELYKNVSLEFFYEILMAKAYNVSGNTELDGHKERRDWFQFLMRISF